jgi:phage-related protein (TIGR01555 family)
MGVVLNFMDRLTNALTGRGTTVDRRVYDFYNFTPVTPQQAEAAYRSSWLVRKIIDIPPFDMTREWRDWQADAKNIEALEAEERRLQIKAKCQRAMVLSRLFGGSALYLGTKDTDPTQPLRPESVAKDGLLYVHVFSRHQISEGQQRLDPADPWFGEPDFFSINSGNGQQVQLHPSRVVPFLGQKAPEGSLMSNGSWYWGDPIMQSIEQAVKNADSAQDGFAGLIDEARVDILKTPKLTEVAATPEGERLIANRLAAAMVGKSNHRALLLDSEETWEQKEVRWAGMPEMIVTYLNAVAGAADIPLTRLLGVSPKGMQSTGDGEERDYQSMVRARQNELLSPALDRIDDALVRSALGSKPSDIYYEFAPLSQMDEKDAATIEKQRADTVKVYADSGLIPDVALSAMAKNSIVESGRWPGSEKAFEEAANEPLPNEQDPGQLATLEQRLSAMEKKGTISTVQKDALITDAAPRSLYVSRKLLNGADLIKWAKGQGFATTVPAGELHVTVLFSRTPVDWLKMGSPWDQDDQGRLKVAPGGARIVEPLGDKGAIVLLFNSSTLTWRHEDMVRQGASHDFDEYQPHVTITYEGGDIDLSKVEPYRGELVFGPEVFAEVVDDWEKGLTEDAAQ